MSVLAFLIPTSIVLGLLGLGAFLWSMRSGQYEDLMGSAERILMDEEDRPLPPARDEPERPADRGEGG